MCDLRLREGFFYSPPMPYVFPQEDLFVGVVVFVIVGLLIVRAVVVRKQRARRGESDHSPSDP